MRIYRREFGHEYATYSFGYTIHGEQEPGDKLAQIYAEGFLPYTITETTGELFYMSRSVRLALATYQPTSENRRILRKFDGQFSTREISHAELIQDTAFSNLFLTYFAERHGPDIMPAERLTRILARTLPLRAIAYEQAGIPVAYVVEVAEDGFSHYWYSCYALEHARTSLGMWLILDAIRRAREETREYFYLGTAYGEKARYKTNIPHLEFWDGTNWQKNTRLLEECMQRD